jgi:hypothetical protein
MILSLYIEWSIDLVIDRINLSYHGALIRCMFTIQMLASLENTVLEIRFIN